MKALKVAMLASALTLLASCGKSQQSSFAVSSKVEPTSSKSAEASEQSEVTEQSEASEEATSESLEQLKIYCARTDISSMEEPETIGASFVYVGKPYLIKVYAYDQAQEAPLESDLIEYSCTANDGTTVIDYVDVQPGEKSNEFIFTAKKKALQYGRFDIAGKVRLKGEKAWLAAPHIYSIDVYEAPEASDAE